MKKCLSLFISLAILFTFCMPSYATDSFSVADPKQSPHSMEDTHLLGEIPTLQLLDQLRTIADDVDYSDAELVVYVNEIASRSTDFTDEDLISMIADNSDDVNFRRALLETYLSKYNFTISDNAFLDMLQDPQFDDGMKILIIVCLDDDLLTSPSTQSALIALSNSCNTRVAYHAIKALAKGNLQQALDISTEILKNLESESEERINIALNLFAENYPTVDMSAILNSGHLDFVDYLCDVYQNADSEEVRVAVETSLATISTQEAFLALENIRSLTPQPYINGVGGYIAYRDGVKVAGIEFWHAAIATEGYDKYTTKFAQATGVGKTTGIVSYDSFLGESSNNFQGYYQPASVSYYSSYRDSVVATAKEVANLHIPYVAATCITYRSIPSSQRHYQPSDIKAIRCDGFVEYCLEYNGIEVCGDGTNWDITLNDPYTQDVHDGLMAITPKNQAENYMDKVDLN